MVLNAARDLLLRTGYAETTVNAIAAKAGVSPKTVAGIFGSKSGVLSALLDPAVFGSRFQETIGKLRSESDPRRRVRLAAGLTREIYESMSPEFELMRSAGGVTADLRRHIVPLESRRRENLARLVSFAGKRLRRVRSDNEQIDILLVLTSYETYRTLVVSRGWKPEKYEAWLSGAMTQTIFGGALQ